MRAAVAVVDVVRVAKNLLGVARVPLHRELDADGGRGGVGGRDLGQDGDDLVVHRLLGLVEVLDELADAAPVDEVFFPAAVALVDEEDEKPRVEEGQLAETAREDVELKVGRGEDRRVGAEGDLRTGLVGVADDGQGRDRNP